MRRFLFVLCLVLLVVGVAAAQDSDADTDLPAFGELDEGWNLIEPGGDTICSNGTPFAFWVRPGDSEKVVFYLQGGGACWFGANCDLQSTPTYDPFVTPEGDDNPALADGIFNFENATNPFADYSFVFVPYCTADVHVGNSQTTYEVTGANGETREVTIHHNGYNNVSAVLDWLYANVEAPSQIFVSGSSAGSTPSPFYAGLLAEHYADAQIAVLGDAAGGYYNPDLLTPVINAWDVASILPDWEEYEGITNDTLNFEDFYIATGNHFPDVLLAQYNTAHDSSQYSFLRLLGARDKLLPERLHMAFDYIMAGLQEDNFTYYTAPGTLHMILPLPEFYELEVEGVKLVDWVAQLANGELPDPVECTDCGEPPTAGE